MTTGKMGGGSGEKAEGDLSEIPLRFWKPADARLRAGCGKNPLLAKKLGHDRGGQARSLLIIWQ